MVPRAARREPPIGQNGARRNFRLAQSFGPGLAILGKPDSRGAIGRGGESVTGKSFDRRFRRIVERAAAWAPPGMLRAPVRWARGMEETHKLAQSDYAFVSYGKCGRTWLNAM